TISQNPGVIRVEAIPVLYPEVYHSEQALGVRASGGRVFPTLAETAGPTGRGVSVAILDSGVNDVAQGNYPGHEPLVGRGLGVGLVEALDWIYANRARPWSGADASYAGIDVVNISLSSVDRSDGRDASCRMVDALAGAGIVIVCSMGNDARVGFVPSPAAAD